MYHFQSFVLRVEGLEHSIHFRGAVSQSDALACPSGERRETGCRRHQVYAGNRRQARKTLVFMGISACHRISQTAGKIKRLLILLRVRFFSFFSFHRAKALN